jgi:hypothetical protein
VPAKVLVSLTQRLRALPIYKQRRSQCVNDNAPGRVITSLERDSWRRVVLVTATSREQIMAIDERETISLIGSDKVEGTAVYGPDANKIGIIERVMIEKRTGHVSYAVLSFGGFLGIGDDHYPLPWPTLKYNVDLGGYQTLITADQLEGAPKYSRASDWNWADAEGARRVNDYYGVPI